jgi:enolase
MERRVPLYRHFADIIGCDNVTLPRLTINLFSGGKHAGGQVAIQDVLIAPVSAASIDESLVMASSVYHAASELVSRKYNMRLLRADEGGLAPPALETEALIQDAVDAISDAGFEPGREVALAIDVAASHFYTDGRYHLDGAHLTSSDMIERMRKWAERYPIISIEDGLAESDWENWPLLKQEIGRGALVLGDDLLCTNPARIHRAVKANAANALLLKVNQIGTLSEAAEAHRLAREAGWSVTASARSGETEDDWLADLAVGWSCRHIKIGSITQSERLAKYNRLLSIEAEGGAALSV